MASERSALEYIRSRVVVDLRKGNAAAIVQALGHANNISSEAKEGGEEIKAALKVRAQS